MASDDQFDKLFSPFDKQRDKFESQYTIVVYDLTTEELLEKIKHQGKLIDNIGERVKRAHLQHKIWLLKEYVDKKISIDKWNCIFLVGQNDTLDEIPLASEWLIVLCTWSVPRWQFHYGEYFAIATLRDLFTNTRGRHVVHIHNNKLSHALVTPTKRRLLHNEETKGLDLDAYFATDGIGRSMIKAHPLNLGDKILICGTSVALRTTKLPTETFIISTKSLRDEEICELFEKEAAATVGGELDKWLAEMANPKMMHRLAFGATIRQKIQTGELETLYAIATVAAKIREKCPIDKLRTFTIKEITHTRLEKEFDGAVGITYY